MSLEAVPVAELTAQQFTARFQVGRVLVERATELKLEIDELYDGFRKNAPLDMTQSSPDVYMPPLDAVPEPAAVEYTRMMLAMNGINTTVRHWEASLNETMNNKPVVVSRLQPEGVSPILKRAYRSNPMYGAWTELVGRPDVIQGTISRVSLTDNTLVIRPRKLTADATNDVTYHTPFLDKNGFPLVTVEFREPTFRDRREPGRMAKISKSMFGF